MAGELKEKSTLRLVATKAILKNLQDIPEKSDGKGGTYPAKTQCAISAGAADFFLSSRVTDLTQLPEMEPVDVEADVLRIGGGKGFIVLEVGMVSVRPHIPVNKPVKTDK